MTTTHQECADAWAQQTGKKTSAGHLNYRGMVLHSYGTPIAALYEIGGQRIALISARHFSKSTSACQGIAAEAAKNAGWEVWRVGYAVNLKDNFDWYQDRLREMADRQDKARFDSTRTYYRQECSRYYREKAAYLQLFGPRNQSKPRQPDRIPIDALL